MQTHIYCGMPLSEFPHQQNFDRATISISCNEELPFFTIIAWIMLNREWMLYPIYGGQQVEVCVGIARLYLTFWLNAATDMECICTHTHADAGTHAHTHTHTHTHTHLM